MSTSTVIGDARKASIFLMEREPLISRWIADFLAERGVSSRPVATLGEIFKAARLDVPMALVVDLESTGLDVYPAERIGPEHFLRVLRQAYPRLCIIAMFASPSAGLEALCRELGIPLIIKPFGSAQLLGFLEHCGAVDHALADGPVELY